MTKVEFLYTFGGNQLKKELSKVFADIILSNSDIKEALYLCVWVSKTSRNRWVEISCSNDIKIPYDKLMETGKIEELTKTTKGTVSLNCIASPRDLNKEWVALLKYNYKIQGDILHVPYEEGDDYNFISTTPEHWNMEIPITSYKFKLKKDFHI